MKRCAECGKKLVGLPGLARRVVCDSVCATAWKTFAPKHADRMFWPKVDRSGGPRACWPYHRLDPLGYGRFMKQGPYAYAHRTAWLLTKGKIPEGMEVAHTCDNRGCCNPAHLFLASHAENMADCKAKDRQARGERTKRNKLTADDVLDIRKRFVRIYANSSNIPALAREYGVSKACVRDAVLRIRWKHLN